MTKSIVVATCPIMAGTCLHHSHDTAHLVNNTSHHGHDTSHHGNHGSRHGHDGSHHGRRVDPVCPHVPVSPCHLRRSGTRPRSRSCSVARRSCPDGRNGYSGHLQGHRDMRGTRGWGRTQGERTSGRHGDRAVTCGGRGSAVDARGPRGTWGHKHGEKISRDKVGQRDRRGHRGRTRVRLCGSRGGREESAGVEGT